MIRLSLALLAIVTVACSASRPATRYDVWGWSIAIPDDLDVRPANDVDDIWANGPLLITGGPGSSRTLHVRVEPLDPGTASPTPPTALQLLRQVAAGADSEEVGPVTARRFPVGDGAMVHAVRLGLDLDIAYIVARGSLITVTASEMTPADVEFIAASFAFREPPGDPSRPPSRSPTPQAATPRAPLLRARGRRDSLG